MLTQSLRQQIKQGYAHALKDAIVPAGPVPHILPLDAAA